MGAMVEENVNAIEEDDKNYVPLVPGKSPEEEDKELIVDENIDQAELADLIDDGPEGNNPQEDENSQNDNVHSELGDDESS